MAKWKIWLAALLIFSSGIATGTVGYGLVLKSRYSSEARGEPRRPWILRKLTRKLDLSPEQQAKILPAIARADQKFLDLRASARPEIERILSDLEQEISSSLEADQQATFKRLQERFLKRFALKQADKPQVAPSPALP